MGDSSGCFRHDGWDQPDHEVLIIGAGLSGLRTLIAMKQLGLGAKVIERGSDAGGVWYWNRYPGARLDSESYTYTFSFSQEVLNEYSWGELFSAQPDVLKMVHHYVNKFKLRENIQFNTEVKRAHYLEESRSWLLTDQNGRSYTSRFLFNCLGPLTSPTLPDIPGISDFRGVAYHTSRWPHEEISFEGKRVGVIGTGATGIQVIQEVSKQAASTFVFQRTANWTAPMGNAKISAAEMEELRERLPGVLQTCRSNPFGFRFRPVAKNTLEVPEEERERFWEELYNAPGLCKWVGNYQDILTNPEANALYSVWMRERIRKRINDPTLAEKLLPRHGFGLRRVPLESGYYELFNKPNVKLIDLQETPITKVTSTGIQTSAEHVDLDVLIYATGFDALTGSFEEIEYYGEGGMTLKEKWADGPCTFLGLTVRSFPNMFNILGPHQSTGNMPHVIEYAVEWTSRLIKHGMERNVTYINAQEDGEKWWTEHALSLAQGQLAFSVDSWMTGFVSNKAGKRQRRIIRYFGTNNEFQRRCNSIESDGYKWLTLK